MRETFGKHVGDLWWVGGRLCGVWQAGWGVWWVEASNTKPGWSRSWGRGSGFWERVRKLEKITKSLFFQGVANNYEKNHGFPLVL